MRERSEVSEMHDPVGNARPRGAGAALELSAVSIPAGEVGGDLLEMLPSGPDALTFYVADVIGKGARASALGGAVRAAFRRAAEDDVSPGAVCGRVNGLLCGTFALAQFATCFYGVLDRRSGLLRYTRAGHNPALLVRGDGTMLRLMDGGGLLGAFGGLRYGEGCVRLAPGDRLLLYTDGLTEATDAEGRELGEAGVADLLQRHRRLGARTLQRTLVSALERYRLRDDVTVGVLAAA